MPAFPRQAALRRHRPRTPDFGGLRASGLNVEEASLSAYLPARPTGREAPPLGVVRPRGTQEVAALVRWAREQGMALTTFSSAPGPRRRGATAEQPTLFVDLGGMDQMLKVDGQDAVAVIEPGVTFGALDALLAPQGLRAFKPLLPRAGKSVLASYLEREPTLQSSEQWDVVDPFGGAQLVFGTGETFRTGGAAISGSLDENWAAGLRYLTAVGPAGTDFLRVVQGSQGTLAILCWAAILCERLPLLEEACFVGADSLAPLARLSLELHRRRIGRATFIASGVHLAAVLETEPERIAEVAAGLPPFVLYVQLAACSEFPEERIAYQREDLAHLAAKAGLAAVDELGGRSAQEISALQARPPADDYKDRIAGAHRSVFFLTQLDRVERFVALAQERVARAPGVTLSVYVQPRLHGRNCHLEFVLAHDPDATFAVAAADGIAADLAEACCAQGGFFSRPYGAWAEMAFRRNSTILPLLRETKSIFDPDHILNPGRLGFQ
ncbi:FAD-binding oxidoreductase [Ancylobacter sp. IITR112]|uniref:FAD-binding oxidoreductase n=1 Tax=Ancylobacter sp. IITR112 TaxID=3138073 RepID=UPI00352A9489